VFNLEALLTRLIADSVWSKQEARAMKHHLKEKGDHLFDLTLTPLTQSV
jgi:hypothetical protein